MAMDGVVKVRCPRVRYSIGAGPLEDLMPRMPYLEWAEERAKVDPRFRTAFGTVRF